MEEENNGNEINGILDSNHIQNKTQVLQQEDNKMFCPVPINAFLERGPKSVPDDSEEGIGMELEIRLSVKRFLILFIFSMITMSNGAIWITLGSISNIAMAYYSIEYDVVNWFSMSYLLGYSVMAFPASIFLSKCGLKACIVMAASLNGVGSCLRYGGIERNGFVFVATGQTIAAIGSAFVLQVPPKLAAVWFGEHERATATSVGVLMNLVGVAVGFIQPTLLVTDSDDMDIVKQGMDKLMLSQAIFCVAFVIAAYIFVDEKPKIPPSLSEALRDDKTSHSTHLSVRQSMTILFRSKSFNLTAQAYGIMFGLMTSLSTVLNQTIKSKYAFVSDFHIGLLGFSSTLLGSFFTLVTGVLIDKYQKYKLTAVLLFIFTILSMTGFTLVLLHMKNFTLLFVLYCSMNIAILPYLSCGLEQISEITYPVEEDISCSIALIFGNFYGFLLTFAIGWFINKNMVQLAYLIMTAIFALGLLFIIIAKVPMRRSLADHAVNK